MFFISGRYFSLLCKCRDCEYLRPGCKDKGNGIIQHPLKGFSPWYILCRDNRTIEEGFCPRDNEWGVQKFPYNGQCVHLFAIPNEFNSIGMLPSCNGKPDGNYQFRERPCDAYYKCEDGVAIAVKCPGNTMFDSSNRTCKIGGKCNE